MRRRRMQRREVQKLSNPPRNLGLFGRLQLLFGNTLTQWGGAFLGFGLFLVLSMSGPEMIQSMVVFSGSLEVSKGSVTGSEETDTEDNEQSVYRVFYKFTAKDGQEYEGVSYKTGRGLPKGSSVTVEYSPGDPGRYSRIKGFRYTASGVVVFVFFLFPLVGLGLAVPGTMRGLRANRLLKNGNFGFARLVEMRETDAEIDDEPVMELFFEFEADDGNTYEVVEKTHEPDDLLDEEEEIVLYDPKHPEDAMMVDNLPGRPTLNAEGRFEFSTFRGLSRMILPGLSLWQFVRFVLSFFG